MRTFLLERMSWFTALAAFAASLEWEGLAAKGFDAA